MRLVILFVVMLLQFTFAGSTHAADRIDQVALEQRLCEAVAKSDVPNIRQHPQAYECLCLDFEALVYEIFWKLNTSLLLDDQKFTIIYKTFRNINYKEFDHLLEERFHPFIALAPHPVVSIGVEKFREIVFANCISLKELYKINEELNNLSNEDVENYAIAIFSRYATKEVFNKILRLWAANTNKSSDCSMQ